MGSFGTSKPIKNYFMKFKILTFTSIFLIHNAYSQNLYLEIPEEYSDKVIVSCIIDSINKKENLSSYLIYQNSLADGEIQTHLFCNANGIVHSWIILKGIVLKTKSVSDKSIFNYKDFKKTGAVKSEDKLSFKPPMLSVIENETVIFYSKKTKFYFEYGKNVTTYEPDLRRESFRKKWLKIIRKFI